MPRLVASWCARGASDRSMPRTRGGIPCVSSKKELFTQGSLPRRAPTRNRALFAFLPQQRDGFAELFSRALVDECLDRFVDRQPPFVAPFRRRLVGGGSEDEVLNADDHFSRRELERRADTGTELADDAGFL